MRSIVYITELICCDISIKALWGCQKKVLTHFPESWLTRSDLNTFLQQQRGWIFTGSACFWVHIGTSVLVLRNRYCETKAMKGSFQRTMKLLPPHHCAVAFSRSNKLKLSSPEMTKQRYHWGNCIALCTIHVFITLDQIKPRSIIFLMVYRSIKQHIGAYVGTKLVL